MSDQRRMPSFDDPPPQTQWRQSSTSASSSTGNRGPLIIGAVAIGLAAVVAVTMGLAMRGGSSSPTTSRQVVDSSDDSNDGSSSSNTESTTTPATSATRLSRSYGGTMFGKRGNYDFTMILRGRSDGNVSGRIIQRHDDGTVAGTEIVSGSLSGRDLDLSTDRWLAGGDWDKTDFYYLQFQDSQLRRFGGEFKCIECGTGRLPIRGKAR